MVTARDREAWLARLRPRLVAVARRRVPEEAVEDVVQDALKVIVEKGLPGGTAAEAAPPAGLPDLPWCFRVLRNVIGNHYQRQRVRARELSPADVHPAPPPETPLEALEERERARLVRASIESLSATDSECGRYMARLLEGASPRTLAEEASVSPAILYRRLYRCRGKLRSILRAKGVLA